MGFRLDRTYALRFAGSLDGLEVDIRSTTVGVVSRLREAALADTALFAELLAEHVISWNYEDEDGKELPIVPESFLSLEEPVLAAIVREWYKAATGVTAPLDEGSTYGAPRREATSMNSSLEADLPMTPLG